MPSLGLDALTIRRRPGHRLVDVAGALRYQPSRGPRFIWPASTRATGVLVPPISLYSRARVVPFEPAHLRLELAAPDRLRVVEALVGEAVAALAPHPGVRAVRAGDVGAEQVHDLGLRSGTSPGRPSAAAARGRRRCRRRGSAPCPGGAQLVVDVLVVLVGADHVVEVLRLGAELLQVGQELQARVADGAVHEGGAEGDALGRRRALRRGQDGEVAAALRGAGSCAPGP